MGTRFINIRERLEMYNSVKPLVGTLRLKEHGIWSNIFGSILLVNHLLAENWLCIRAES